MNVEPPPPPPESLKRSFSGSSNYSLPAVLEPSNPGLLEPSLPGLPDAIWTTVLSYLGVSDLRNLLLVSRSIKQKTQVHLYHELTLTEWASSGARLARAIHQGVVSDETCSCIEKLRFQFTSIEEIREALELTINIHPRMPNIVSIDVEAYFSEHGMVVVGMLAQTYKSCRIIGLSARARGEHSLPIAQNVLPLLTTLRIPWLFANEPPLLVRVSDLELEALYSDQHAVEWADQPCQLDPHVLDRLAVTYSTYVKLGSPPALQLEILVEPGDTVLNISDAACTTLKIAAMHDLPDVRPSLHAPSLRGLILCNIAPLPTIWLLQNNKLDTVEFLSIAPGTLPALQAVGSQPVFPALRLLLIMVMGTSFLTATPTLRKRESRKLVEWLQMLASQYPVDVRDAGWLLRQDIYFSDGLWCLTSQTRYRKYLHLVAPPPLKS